MASIVNDPDTLEAQAGIIEDLSLKFKDQYTKMFTVVENLSSSWKGQDNVNFANTVTGYREDFEKIKSTIDEYATFMKQAAKVYREVQSAAATGASKL